MPAFTGPATAGLRAYPNPLNSRATIEYALSEREEVALYLFDIFGKKLQVLTSGETKEEGVHRVEFDAASLSAGTYVLVLQRGTARESIRLTVVR